MIKQRPLLTCVPIFALAAANAPGQTKNVVFIIVDDMRPTLGCMGDDDAITPHLDAFAAESVLFDRAYCQQALSGPTRASLFTGMYPDDTGVTELNTLMRARIPDIKTLPQLFRESGYESFGIGKVFHGDANGVDSLSWSEKPCCYHYTKNEEYLLPEHRTGKKSVAYEFTEEDPSGYLDIKTRDAALERIRLLGESKTPFFLAVGFLKPHLPFCAPQRYWDMYEGKSVVADTSRVIGAPKLAYHDSQELRGYTDIPSMGDIDLEQQRMLRRAYYACSTFADDNVGAVLEALKEAGLYDDCVIVFAGDHGYHLGEQGLWCKSTNYDYACRAPLIIHDAGQKKGIVRKDFVQFVDILPTVCSLCGIAVPESLPGKDIYSGKGRKYALSQFVRPYGSITHAEEKTHTGYVIRTKAWTYVEWISLSGAVTDRELYYTRFNPHESKNLSGKRLFRKKMESLSGLMHRAYEIKN